MVFSALLPGERLRWFHLAGAVLGLTGAGLLVTKGEGLGFDARYSLGYGAAMACALIWSTYSVASRRLGKVPTDAVGGFSGATALLAVPCHLAFETTVWPEGTVEWLALLALGLGSVGGSYFAWDIGVKRGDIQVLGAADAVRGEPCPGAPGRLNASGALPDLVGRPVTAQEPPR